MAGNIFCPQWVYHAVNRVFGIFPLKLWMAFAGLGGFVIGLGIFTFGYAQGFSYLSSDPRACVNCHVMRDVYDGWNHSSHKAVATCNDCHIPHSFGAKYVAKALNGWHHSFAFTTDKFDEPIRIKAYNRNILQQNCLDCHGSMVDGIAHTDSKESTDCLNCHSGVGHGK